MIKLLRMILHKLVRGMTWPKFALLLSSVLIALVIGEVVVRRTNVDWKYTEKTLYFQHADLEAHQPVMDVDYLYGLKTGTYEFAKNTVTVNDFQNRDTQRTITKPDDVYRIIVVGGSNVYGAALNDSETWPAQLEKALNEYGQRRFEVWNLGVSAYVGRQMIAVAKAAVARYDPDLVIIALSNAGMRAFLAGSDLKSYFDKWPQLWFEMVIAPHFDLLPDFINHFLLKNLRVYRYSLIALTGMMQMRSLHLDHHEQQNIEAVREFVKTTQGKVDVGIYICPAFDGAEFTDYYDGLDVKVFKPKGAHLPMDYRTLHPPAPIMIWYAEILTAWLKSDFDLWPDKPD